MWKLSSRTRPRQTVAPDFPVSDAPGQAATQAGSPVRVLLLGFLLAGFARLTWGLGDKGLWWDESLSLQRAEQPWWPLLQGQLNMFDGLIWHTTLDQHPFFYFLLQGLMLRVAGTSEYALRFVSVMAATLLIAAVWTLSRALVRRGGAPPATPIFAALMASVSPFFLWYGQEARPYALWALLAVLAAYWLLRLALDAPPSEPRRAAWILYAATALAFLTTHYYAVFHLPIHALGWFVRLYTRRPKTAVALAGGLLALGALASGLVYYRIIVMQGGGGNFPTINLRILAPDLLNAFSLGLSVNINQVWWLNLVYGAVALTGLAWMLWRPRRLRAGGWIPVLMVLGPVVAVLAVNLLTPAYMNARHLSLIGGGYLIGLGAGLGAIWQWRPSMRSGLSNATVGPFLAIPLTCLLIAGAGYSTRNYFTQEEYTNDDLAGVGRHLAGRLAEGDLILLKPPFSWRIFDYYLPFAGVDAASAQNAHVRRLGVPFLRTGWENRAAALAHYTPQYRRIWLVVLGTHPYMDLEDRTEAWLDDHLFKVSTLRYFSHSQLSVTLYLPEVPVTWDEPAMAHRHSVTFGAPDSDQLVLAGYALGEQLYDNLALPVTLYWQTLTDTDRRYKYLLRLVEVETARDDATQDQTAITPPIVNVLALTEREPYDGAIPTLYWAPGQTILEMSELPPGDWESVRQNPARYRLAIEVYDAETLAKLPVMDVAGDAQTGGDYALLPFAP